MYHLQPDGPSGCDGTDWIVIWRSADRHTGRRQPLARNSLAECCTANCVDCGRLPDPIGLLGRSCDEVIRSLTLFAEYFLAIAAHTGFQYRFCSAPPTPLPDGYLLEEYPVMDRSA